MIPPHLAKFPWYAAHCAWCVTAYGQSRHQAPAATVAGRADLRGADLRKASLSGASLRWADLRGANLRGADLRGANLRGANLRGADLRSANLIRADLSGADLSGADLPAPTVVLQAYWGMLSDGITADLMRFDAACHPDPTAFDRWAAGGPCPHDRDHIPRAASFTDRRYLWAPGPCPRPYDLLVVVLAEKCPAWTDEQRTAFEARFAPKPNP